MPSTIKKIKWKDNVPYACRHCGTWAKYAISLDVEEIKCINCKKTSKVEVHASNVFLKGVE